MENKKRGETAHSGGYGSGELTMGELIMYNLLFFIPLSIAIAFSVFLSKWITPLFETTRGVTVQILMVLFTVVIFALIIPIIRKRESVQGVRYSLFGFLIIAIGLTLPSIIVQKDFSLLLIEMPHIATYLLLTFIYTPEVLGMDIDISKWFKHYKQLMIIIIYCSIVLLYVSGFGYIFYSIATTQPDAFAYNVNKPVQYSQYLYFSVISFTTIGYGDITPVSAGARFAVSVEAIVGSIVNVIFIAILFVYVSNFQSFIKGVKEEEKMIMKEEKEIKSIEEKILFKNKRKKKS